MKVINLSSLDGSNGFRLDGVTEGDLTGASVSTAGDVNGDGFDDVIVGAPRANPATMSPNGSTYLVFGKATGFSAEIALSSLDGVTGSRLDGGRADDNGVGSGGAISTAGDVNGDGLDDLIIGAPGFGTDHPTGISYVVFGKTSSFGATFALSTLDGESGFFIGPGGAHSEFSSTVSNAGDFNGDGFDEIIIGSPVSGRDISPGSFIVAYGKASGFSPYDGKEGFAVSAEKFNTLGGTVSGAGDINGDGFDDVIVSSKNFYDSSSSYVIFGGMGFNGNLLSLDGTNGFRLIGGVSPIDFWGVSVSDAGDINGDGYDDLITGSYVVFGKASGFSARLDISNMDGSSGFRFDSGGSVTNAGDVNGDGFGDLIIGGRDANGDGAGSSYVVYGKASGFSAIWDLSNLDDNAGFRLDGVAAGDGSGGSVSSAGDVNGDGFDDLIIGAAGADPNGEGSGSSYVMFGGDFTNAVTFLGTSGDDGLISGTPAAESFVAGNGNDTMTGGGGADVFHGGEGNDIIQVSDLSFQLVDGGLGSDTLDMASSSSNVDLINIRGRLNGIEAINLTGNGNNTVTLTAVDLLNLSDSSNTLRVDGDDGDRIIGLGIGWVDGGIVENYQMYTQGAAILQIDPSITTDFPVSGLIDLSNLNGNNGFRIDGIAAGDGSGGSVSNAGDVNNDGFDDLIIGARHADPNGEKSGTSYVMFGKAAGFGDAFDLSDIDGSNGFRVVGTAENDKSGISVSTAGDVNGDGIGDLIVGAYYSDTNGNNAGSSYVVFGKTSGFNAEVALSSLDGNNGFCIDGVAADDHSGFSVSNAGDVNGDGFADLIIGARYADRTGGKSGASYIMFGKASGFSATFDLADLDGNNGFRLDGVAADDRSGRSVSNAGDVNGDGFDDVIVGASLADSHGRSSGSSYVIFGKASGFSATMALSSLDGHTGFRLDGVMAGDQSGFSVSAAGDINGDGFADVIVGARSADLHGDKSGASYVVFGKASGFDASIDLSSLDGDTGFRVGGVAADDQSGWSVSSAGDFNGDGFDDVIVGARWADSSNQDAGASYVLFGKASGFNATFDLSDIDGINGLRLEGTKASDGLGKSVSSAGDVNGDGFSDLIIGATGADPNGRNSGSSYVLFGDNFTTAVTYLGTTKEELLVGSADSERFVAGNGNDTMIGGGGADTFHGGEGDDHIEVFDLNFQLVEGGSGSDTLALAGSNLNLNLSTVHSKVSSIEAVNLTGRGNNTLTLTAVDLLNLSDSSNSLTVDGNAGDRVFGLDNDWADGGISGDYHLYTQGAAELLVGIAVTTVFPVPGVINLINLHSGVGFRLDGEGNDSGFSVSGAGDVNGDGFDDVIIASPTASPNDIGNAGSSYVVFGKASGFSDTLALSSLDGKTGFQLNGGKVLDQTGYSVSGAGDVSGDGFDDLIVGCKRTSVSYVVFGKASGFDATLNLADLNGSDGFRLEGVIGELTGLSVSNAGDVNGDSFDDVIVGAPDASPNGTFSGSSYVIFGKASGFDSTLNLLDLNGNNGFRLDGAIASGFSGRTVSSAGDINDDGFDDVIISTPGFGPNWTNYVVFGKASGFGASLVLSNLDGSNGFRLEGDTGGSVSDAGDMNGDGFDDLITGNYVVFGKASGFGARLDVSSLDGSTGFRFDGGGVGSSAGDVNGDGFDDLIIGDSSANPNGQSSAGTCYVLFGKASGFSAIMDLSSLDGNNGFRLDGAAEYDRSGFSISSAGDVNGDGFDDLIIGTPGADSSYVIFGRSDFGIGLPEIMGTSGDGLLKDTSAEEDFKAGAGDDHIIGHGGADVFEGGAGDDKIRVADLDFTLIDGGAGNDVLHLVGNGLNLNLADSGDNISSIETICLYGQGDNTLTLTAADLLNLSDTTNTLTVNGNAGDRITVQNSGWTDGGSHDGYHTYIHDNAVLLVGVNVTIDFA
ncbi:hypothetical protein [Nitrosomonas sp.]|uniref:hypothetical protein n=1 Tax=Nitrosomonas sp. TaxID=42353 RepID=UPI00261A0BD7|nr:hypothetical protein [Nitrosomonas sp.]